VQLYTPISSVLRMTSF